MFENKRSETCGVQAAIPRPARNLLWYLVDTMEVEEKDSLQLFHLEAVSENGVERQKIVHTQENPPYEQVRIADLNPVDAKVCVIDDGDHTTMLLAGEYGGEVL